MIPLVNKVREALDRDGIWTTDELVAEINAHRAFPWFNKEGAVIASLLRGVNHHEVNCWVVAGELADCVEMLPEIEDWGRRIGATYIRGLGRPGWQRVLAKHGFGLHAVTMRKSLVKEPD